jgi:hypothetical protein
LLEEGTVTNDKKDQVIADLRDMGIGMFDTVPVATYNRMVRKRDEAVAERDQAREQLAREWNSAAVPGGVDLVAAYQAWLDWYNADKRDEVGSLSHELARGYVLSLIAELLHYRREQGVHE